MDVRRKNHGGPDGQRHLRDLPTSRLPERIYTSPRWPLSDPDYMSGGRPYTQKSSGRLSKEPSSFRHSGRGATGWGRGLLLYSYGTQAKPNTRSDTRPSHSQGQLPLGRTAAFARQAHDGAAFRPTNSWPPLDLRLPIHSGDAASIR